MKYNVELEIDTDRDIEVAESDLIEALESKGFVVDSINIEEE